MLPSLSPPLQLKWYISLNSSTVINAITYTSPPLDPSSIIYHGMCSKLAAPQLGQILCQFVLWSFLSYAWYNSLTNIASSFPQKMAHQCDYALPLPLPASYSRMLFKCGGTITIYVSLILFLSYSWHDWFFRCWLLPLPDMSLTQLLVMECLQN